VKPVFVRPLRQCILLAVLSVVLNLWLLPYIELCFVGFPSGFVLWGVDVVLSLLGFCLFLPLLSFEFGSLPKRAVVRLPMLAATVLLVLFYSLFFLADSLVGSGTPDSANASAIVEQVTQAQLANTSVAVPPSKAVYWEEYKFGLFRRRAVDISVYGPFKPGQQSSIIAIVKKYKAEHSMVPVYLVFFKRENWTALQNGGTRGYEQVKRISVIR
jgi:hypothetical protein